MDSFFQRWKAAIYFIVSTILAFTAFSIALRSAVTSPSRRHHPPSPAPSLSPPPPPTPLPRLSLNATTALRRSGFSLSASLLRESPQTFFSSSPQSTVFAVKDSAFSSAAASPAAASAVSRALSKQLLQYHTSPMGLPMSELLKTPPGSCLPTLVPGKNLVVTKIDVENRAAQINRVKISHPDLVLEGPIVIHGVLETFSSVDAGGDDGGLIPAATCGADARNSSLVTDSVDFRNTVHWLKIVHSLSARGFVSFAIGLNSVIDGIRRDYKHLKSVTVFSPPDFEYVGSSSPVMDRVVRIHIMPRRISYKELVNLPDKSSLKTLLPGHNLEVKIRGANFTAGRLSINGVEVLVPEIFSSDKFIVHGISRALRIATVSKKKSRTK